jgi:hypothetical protein
MFGVVSISKNHPYKTFKNFLNLAVPQEEDRADLAAYSVLESDSDLVQPGGRLYESAVRLAR